MITIFRKYENLPELPYLGFEFVNYYPEGGWNDFKGYHDNIENIIKGYEENEYYKINKVHLFVQVVEKKSLSVVLEGEGFFDYGEKIYKWKWERS